MTLNHTRAHTGGHVRARERVLAFARTNVHTCARALTAHARGYASKVHFFHAEFARREKRGRAAMVVTVAVMMAVAMVMAVAAVVVVAMVVTGGR